MFSARSRIASGLTSTVISVVLIALNLGFLPDYREVAMRGRAQLCEAIAANSSVVVRQRDVRRLDSILGMVVRRNEEILSAAVRKADGSLVAEINDHDNYWTPLTNDEPSETQVMVPVHSNSRKWGTVELRFSPISKPGLWGFFQRPRTLFVLFVGAVTYLLTSLYLGRTLQQMDPSKVVPGRVRSALDTLAEGLLVLDPNQRIMLANQAFAAMVGQTPEQLLGRMASELPWDFAQDTSSVEWPWARAIDDQSTLAGAMMHLCDHEGKRRTFVVNCTPIIGNDEKNRGVLASFEDVTQLEETQQELSRSKEVADAANRAKSEFLARMSHEIRTPMNSILGFTDVLRRGFDVDAGERQEYLDTIHASGQHLLNLINDILDLSKVESGRLEVERLRCTPLKLIHEAVAVFRGQADKKGISLASETPSPVPETIHTDPVRFRQLLTNLIGNALKFTESGGIRVVARVIENGPQPQLAVDVIDTGIGIREETLNRIFDPFVQADTSVTRRFGGTGLGLAISRRFAQALGGDLTVTSDHGSGSTFTFTVDTGPLEDVRRISVDEIHLEPKNPRAQTDIHGQLPPAKILIVDDGDANRKLISLVLSRAGAIVESARNGKEAISVVANGPFHVILMDMQMPVMDGYTATRKLREQGVDVPILALTADAMKGAERKCLDAGCSGFLTKPIDMNQLVTALHDVLRDQGLCLPSSPTALPPTNAATAPNDSPIHSALPQDDVEFCQVIAQFSDRLHDKLVVMRQAVTDEDFATLASEAHWLKGSGGMAGFQILTELGIQLEDAVKSRQSIPDAAGTLMEIQSVADRIVVPQLSPMTPE